MLPYKILWTYRIFWKNWWKGNNVLICPDHALHLLSLHNHKYVKVYNYNTSYNTLFVRFIRIISWVLTMWLISIFETILMPFNFQPTIFSAKKKYKRPCAPYLLYHQFLTRERKKFLKINFFIKFVFYKPNVYKHIYAENH